MAQKPFALALVLFAALSFMCISTAAQGTTSRVTGTVTDSAGAAVPGAAVVLTNEATNVKEGIITSSPVPMPKAAMAVVKAAVPLDVSCAYFDPKVLQMAFSNSTDFHIPLRGPSNP